MKCKDKWTLLYEQVFQTYHDSNWWMLPSHMKKPILEEESLVMNPRSVMMMIYIYDADDDSDEDEDDELDLTTSLIGQILQVLVTSLMLKQTSFTRSLMKIK